MNTDLLMPIQLAFMVSTALLLRWGLGTSALARGEQAPIRFPIVWTALAIWAVGAIFGIVTAFMFGTTSSIVMSCITAAITVFLFVWAARLQRRTASR